MFVREHLGVPSRLRVHKDINTPMYRRGVFHQERARGEEHRQGAERDWCGGFGADDITRG